MKKLFTLLTLALSLGLALSTSGARAQDTNPPQEPRNGGLRVELQKGGKTAAIVTCKGGGTLLQPCRFDAATGTVFIEIPNFEMVFEGKNALFDAPSDTTTFPVEVHVYVRNGRELEMDVLNASGATVHLLPPTQPTQ